MSLHIKSGAALWARGEQHRKMRAGLVGCSLGTRPLKDARDAPHKLQVSPEALAKCKENARTV